jgi:UDPglucose--hexose-1-phosphate uridylyltransferase
MTPLDLLRVPRRSHDSDWQIRVIPDKFAVLRPDVPPLRKGGFFRSMAGFGHHEIVIEHPSHNLEMSDMGTEHIFKLLKVYRTRQQELAHDKDVRFVAIFRQHGAIAGATFSHPHSQIIATAVIPEFMHRKQDIAKAYAGTTQRNLYSEIWQAENADERVIEKSETTLAFVPFAAVVPYEMWIMPGDAHPSFFMATDRDLEGLARILQRCLLRLRNCCGNVAFSYIIYSAVIGEEGPYFRWHLQIMPRLVRPSGIELGPHVWINSMFPEDCAQRLREASATVIDRELLAAG